MSGPAFAAEKAAPKRTTAEDLAATLIAHSTTPSAKNSADTAAPAAGALAADAKVERRIVEGVVSTVTKRAISVEYETKGSASYEMMLPLAAQVKVEGVKALAELNRGDQVKVGIEQTYRENAKGERQILKTEALVVALVQRAPETLTAQPETTTP
jgi:hypothetical protein